MAFQARSAAERAHDRSGDATQFAPCRMHNARLVESPGAANLALKQLLFACYCRDGTSMWRCVRRWWLCSPGKSRPLWSTSSIAIASGTWRQALALVGYHPLPKPRWRGAGNDPLHDHTHQSRRAVARNPYNRQCHRRRVRGGCAEGIYPATLLSSQLLPARGNRYQRPHLRGFDDLGGVQRIICGVNGFFCTSY